jgi:hypothetical protein
MATEIITTTNVFDDIDMNLSPPIKTPADVTIEFSFKDSGRVSVDLTEAHAKELADLLAPYLAVATEVKTTRTRTNRTASNGTGSGSSSSPTWSDGTKLTPAELKAFRVWADGRGAPVTKYSGGGYSYRTDQVREYEAAREAAKSDESK